VVLFPKMPLPLHIFEERYKLMIGRCLDEKSHFGILLVEGGRLFNVGCAAEIIRVVKRYSDGRMDILTEGRRRFRVKQRYQDKPYLEGQVEYFEDEKEPISTDLFEKAVELFKEALSIGTADVEVKLDRASSGPTDVSFFMAWSIVEDLGKRQEMLELSSTSSRLRKIVEFLESILDASKRENEVKRRIRGNGDLPKI